MFRTSSINQVCGLLRSINRLLMSFPNSLSFAKLSSSSLYAHYYLW
nr:MAG TPA: hypothetical protein [Caudoviricetes sp.]